MRSLTTVLAASLVVALGAFAHAAPNGYTPPASDAQAVELFKINRDKKTHFTQDKQVWGRAQIFVDAPMKDVRTAIMDYGNWSQFIPRFQKSKLLKKESNGAAEVYLQMPILKGAATLWAVEKFQPPQSDGKGGEKIVGKFDKGNVEDLQAVWHYRPVDDKHTVVQLDIYVLPKLAVPDGLMISQREDAAGEGVLGVKDKAQQMASLVAVKKP